MINPQEDPDLVSGKFQLDYLREEVLEEYLGKGLIF